MRPLLLDTNAYSAFKRGDSDILELIQTVESIVMSPVVLGELYAGFESGIKTERNRLELQQFLYSPRVIVHPVSVDTANIYAKVYAHLKKNGNPITTNDMWISAQALEHGCYLCTFDKHFDQINGIVIANKLSDLS